MKKEKWCLKVLVTGTHFLIAFLNYDTQEQVHFEISVRKGDFFELVEFVNTRVLYGIGIGTATHDDILLNWMLNSGIEFHQGDFAAFDIYRVSKIIRNAHVLKDEYAPYRKFQWDIPYYQIDLLQYWSKKSRDDKKLGVESFALNLGMDLIGRTLDNDRIVIDSIDTQVDYLFKCLRVSKKLAFYLRDEINLRRWVTANYDLNCLSWDEARISSELHLKYYCRQTGEKPWIVRGRRYEKPSNLKIEDVVPSIRFKTDFFRGIYGQMVHSVNSFTGEFVYQNPDKSRIKLSYGSGGLHTLQKPETFRSTDGKIILTADIRGMYPDLITNYQYISDDLDPCLLSIFAEIQTKRAESIQENNETANQFFKLVLATFSGNLDNPYSWLYAPEKALGMRLHGQLLISRLIEELGLAGLSVISVNTDGIEVQIDQDQVSLFRKVVSGIEQEFSVNFEVDSYRFIAYLSVNDYLAHTHSGKIKAKGQLNYHREPDRGNEFLIIPWAVCQYLVHGIPVEKTITNHHDILDFCSSKNVGPDLQVFYKDERVPNLNRYFVSTPGKGGYLYKKKPEKPKIENLLKGVSLKLLNKVKGNPSGNYPIYFRWYMARCREVIQKLEPVQVQLFA